MAKRKRANGEGTLSRKNNGTWECQIMVGYRPDGKRDIRTFTGKTQKEVKEKRDEFLRKKATGILTGQDLRFDEWADYWYEHHKDHVTATTAEGYRYTLRVLKEHFGRRRLSEIKAMDVEQFLMGMKKAGRSDSTLAQCRGMLFQIFKKAVANDILLKNPVEYAEKMRKTPPKRKEVFTADEVQLLMDNLPENRIGWSIRILLAVGLRGQELLALEPRHISPSGTYITVEQAVVRIKGSVAIGPPKSYDSYRTVPVPEFVQYCARLLRNTDTKFIWESPKKPGQPCNPSYLQDLFKKTVGEVEGVRVLTVHCCRHTCVSQLQALGVSLDTIRSLMGHVDLDTTRHYLHVQESIRQEAAQRYSDAFSKKGRGTYGNILDYMNSS